MNLKMKAKLFATTTIFLMCSFLFASEEFSDTPPKTRHVFSTDISVYGEWPDDAWNKIERTYDIIEDIMEKIHFTMIPPVHDAVRMGAMDRDFVFCRMNADEKIKDHAFVHMEYSHRSKGLHIAPTECSVSDSPDVVRMTLSWAYVNTAARYLLEFDHRAERRDLAARALKDIEEKGWQESVIRIGCVINNDYTCHFYNVFQTPAEQAKNAAVLQELQDYFTSLCTP